MWSVLRLRKERLLWEMQQMRAVGSPQLLVDADRIRGDTNIVSDIVDWKEIVGSGLYGLPTLLKKDAEGTGGWRTSGPWKTQLPQGPV